MVDSLGMYSERYLVMPSKRWSEGTSWGGGMLVMA